MGWLHLVSSLKLQVSFAQYRLFYRALLQKRPIILRSLLMVANPYMKTSKQIWKISKHIWKQQNHIFVFVRVYVCVGGYNMCAKDMNICAKDIKMCAKNMNMCANEPLATKFLPAFAASGMGWLHGVGSFKL